AETGRRDQGTVAAVDLGRGRRWYEQGNEVEAIGELRRALYLSPYEADAHVLLGRIYLQTGQTQAAIVAFKIALWSAESAQAHLAVAQAYAQARNNAGGSAEAHSGLTLAPNQAEAIALL